MLVEYAFIMKIQLIVLVYRQYYNICFQQGISDKRNVKNDYMSHGPVFMSYLMFYLNSMFRI